MNLQPQQLVHVALASNRRYLPGLRATVVSMIRAASEPERLRFHVFSDGLTEEDQIGLRQLAARFGYCVPLDFRVPDMKPLEAAFRAYNGSYTTFLRLYFPEFLCDLDWVLWTDVDVLWFRDPLKFWAERDETVSVVWSPDIPSTRKAARKQFVKWRPGGDMSRYACAGVMLMNLRKMRETGFVQKCAAFVARWGSPIFADQDVLNEICHDDAKLADARWDLLYPIDDIGDGVVIHFNGIGPKFNDATFSGLSPLYEIWFRYVSAVVLGQGTTQVCGGWTRAYFAALALVYPLHRFIAFFTDPIQPWCSDFIQRTLLFAWLRRKRLWK